MSLQSELVEANLERLRNRMPDLPVSSVMIARLLQNLGRSMAAMLENQIRPFGLNDAEFRVLATLFSQPDGVAHPTDLCACTSQSPANMSRISDALVDRDLITRVSSVQDRRKLVLRITSRGEDLVRRLLPPMYRSLREIFKDFSDTEQQQLIGQLKRLGAELELALAPPGTESAE
jgi:MarR family transcriptional repressor of emrRAB